MCRATPPPVLDRSLTLRRTVSDGKICVHGKDGIARKKKAGRAVDFVRITTEAIG
jgi:hypothetical protein